MIGYVGSDIPVPVNLSPIFYITLALTQLMSTHPAFSISPPSETFQPTQYIHSFHLNRTYITDFGVCSRRERSFCNTRPMKMDYVAMMVCRKLLSYLYRLNERLSLPLAGKPAVQ